MKLAFIANARIPSERANAVQTVQMCAAFAAAGAEVTLYYPDRRNSFAGADLHAYYGVPHSFQARRIPCVDWIAPNNQRHPLEKPIFILQTLTFGVALLWRLLRSPAEMYVSRDPFVLALLALVMPHARRRMFFDSHAFPESRAGKAFRNWLSSRVGGMVTNTKALRQLYLGLGLRPEAVLAASNGVNVTRFTSAPDRAAARTALGLPLEERLVVYTGGLYQGRGLEELITAIKGLEAVLVVVGGTDESAATRLKSLAAEVGAVNVRFEGHRPPAEIPLYLSAADVLAMPYSRRTVAPGGVTTDYMSPIKMFEYMAAARPILATDLPVLHEVLRDGENALLVPPDDAAALADGLRRLLTDSALADRIARQARCDVEAFTWDARAQAILNFAKAQWT